MAIQSDGKIVVVGYVLGGGTYDFAVLRYTTAGVLDTTFSGDGQVTIDIDSEHDLAYSVAIQSDGKIVVGGVSGYASANAEFGLARLTSAGELDTSFSTDGKLEVGFGFGDDILGSVAIQGDGKVVAAGYGHNGTNFDVAVARVSTSGVLDTDFSDDGKVLVPVGDGHDYGYAVEVASDGDIVVAGSSHNGADDDVAVVRLTTTGVLDTAFDSDGLVTTAIGGGADVGRSLAIASDGDIVVAGSSNNGANEDVAVVRYTSAGALDTEFSADGKATFIVGSADDNGRAVAIQSDGKIVVVGESNNGANDDVAVLRLSAAGALDTGFSGDGTLTTGIGSGNDVGYGVAVASTGRIVVAGVSRGVDDDFAVVAYTGTSVPGAPTGLSGTAGNTQVSLSWSAPVDTGGSAITGYMVESSVDAGVSWSTVVADTGSTGTTYSATGLTNGATYTFRVSAINAVGTGTASGIASAVPVTTPGAPTGLSGTAGNTQVSLSWSAPVDTGGSAITGYMVESSVDAGVSWSTVVADTGSTDTTYVATGLTNGTTYTFRVSAINAVGGGGASSTSSAVPTAPPPPPPPPPPPTTTTTTPPPPTTTRPPPTTTVAPTTTTTHVPPTTTLQDGGIPPTPTYVG